MLVWAPNGISDAAAGILRSAGHQVMVTPMLCGSGYKVHWTRRMTPFHATDLTTIIACPATGTEHLDEAREAGIKVLSLRDCGDLREIRATIEFTIAAILALTRKLPAACESARAGEWDRMRWQGTDLHWKTAAVVGIGRIGWRVKELLTAFGVYCLSVDTNPECRTVLPLIEILPQADLVTIHADLNPTSRGMFGREQFAAMKRGAYFVNTARGALCDEGALLDALESGHLAGAALDVQAVEPPPADSPLLAFARREPSRLILTPHLGGCTVESLEKAETLLARKLVEVLADGGS